MKPTSMRAAQRWDKQPFFGMKLWLPGSVILFAALTLYCEACTLLMGLPPADIAVTGSWALQITVGWAIVGAFLTTYGARVSDSRLVRKRPIASGIVAILAIAAFALISEMTIAFLRGEAPEVLSLVAVRGPLTLAGSTLAVVVIGLRRFVPQRTDLLEVMTGTGHVSLPTAEIECLEADGNYLNVTHSSGRTYLLRSTMLAAEQRLGPQFVRIHRSVIVNRARIRERRRGGQVVLQSGRIVRIGRAFRSRLT
ncbi:MAG TPA: LytTR family DNA-binding domain-containing protein [Steroidobacteraceae bacterium]|nr:LytTR family DNA-binding domain-containing protein [Steroidobacteraceae bacterium]